VTEVKSPADFLAVAFAERSAVSISPSGKRVKLKKTGPWRSNSLIPAFRLFRSYVAGTARGDVMLKAVMSAG